MLVVDDDPDTLKLFDFIIVQYGARVVTVSTVKGALAAIDRSLPDIVVSDIAMPDQDGYALIKQVRSRPAGKGGRIPVIAATAFPDEHDRATAAGFQLLLVKPVQPPDLALAIIHLLRRNNNLPSQIDNG